MTPEAFRRSTKRAPAVRHAAAARGALARCQGDWATAHRIVMNAQSRRGRVGARYLHRKEGDLENALLVPKAKRPEATGTLEDEWMAIAEALLARD
jgi:hypothetical protein